MQLRYFFLKVHLIDVENSCSVRFFCDSKPCLFLLTELIQVLIAKNLQQSKWEGKKH